MKAIIQKLKKIIKWLVYWIKYILLIIICFIYDLFRSKNSKSNKEKEALQAKRKKLLKPNNLNPLPTTHENNTLIKNSIFIFTEELIKEKIIYFYCQEKELKKYELTNSDEKIIKEITDKMMPQIKLEEKYLKKEDELKELIKKLGKKELNLFHAKQQEKEENILKEESKENFISPNTIKTLLPKQDLKIAKPIFNPEGKYTTQKVVMQNKDTATRRQDKIEYEPIAKVSSKTGKRKLKVIPTSLKSAVIFIPLLEILQKTNINKKSKKQERSKKDNIKLKETTKVNDSKTPKVLKRQDKEQDKKEPTPIKMEKQKYEEQNNKERKKEKLITIDLTSITKEINYLEQAKIIEQEKENFEDKDYEKIIKKVDILLTKIESTNKLPLTKETKEKINAKKRRLIELKENIEVSKAQDITKEENLLEESITTQELMGLEAELKNIYLEQQIALNKYLIDQAENLENLSKDNLKKVERELIKQKIKKASMSLELPTILLFPFIRNRYFLMFSTGIILNNHLHILDHLLRGKTVTYETPDLENIKKGRDALENALYLTNNNLSYLSFLESAILAKYPELSFDTEYLVYINKLKYSLIKNQEKMVKKKEMIKKYNLKYQVKVRKLKKKKIA